MRLYDFRPPSGGDPAGRISIEHAAAACALTQEGRRALLAHLGACPDHDPWVRAVAGAKAALARVFAGPDLPADRVVLGSRVRLGMDGRGAETVTLAPWDEEIAPLGRIALRTRLGIALLGMREGTHVDVPRHDGTFERVAVQAVLYRPGGPGTHAVNDNSSRRETRS